MVDLYSEMKTAAFAVRQAHLDRLRALGVTKGTIADAGAEFFPFGVTEAEPSRGGTYQPGQGLAHIVLPVLERGELVDLCAFRSTAPDEWSLRVGNGWALGLNNCVASHSWEPSVHLSSNPLEWLRRDRAGICILDWRSPELMQLDALDFVTVSDPATARLLAEALSRPVRLPNIQIMEAARAA